MSNPKETELGHTFNYRELREHCELVYGSVALPGKHPGFVVVAGMDKKKKQNGHEIYLLDEYESPDLRKLITQCVALDTKYHITINNTYYRKRLPDRWFGDYKKEAVARFVQEINDEHHRSNPSESGEPGYYFSLSMAAIHEMDGLYSFIIPQLKNMLPEERRTLFLKDSKIKNYLSEIEKNEAVELQLGDYPAIEALAFAVIEMTNDIKQQEAIALLPRNPDPYGGWHPLKRAKRSV